MTSKTCRKCGLMKPLEEYYSTKQSTPDGLRSWCKGCCQAAALARLEARDPEQAAKVKEAAKARRDRNRKFMDELKSGPCVDCGGTFPPVCMDWDHLPGALKVNAVGQLLQSSRKRILEEIAKCELVCANCHRIRTSSRPGWWQLAAGAQTSESS